MFRAWIQKKIVLTIILSVLPHALFAVTSPKDFFNFDPGQNYKLFNYSQIYDYFHLLEKQSDRIQCVEIGTSTLGAPMFYAMISSSKNLADYDRFMKIQQQTSDPQALSCSAQKKLLKNGKAVVSINCSIHAFEIGSSQMAPLLAFELATARDSLLLAQLDDVILLLMPSQNPDGLDRVVAWYDEYSDTGYEKGPYPFPEHPYMGHSINRDWFALTQKETGNTVSHIYNEWFPHIVVDLHQLGKVGPRMVVPPYIDPYDTYLHPRLQSHMAELGSFVMTEMVSKELGGVTCNLFFDAYSPSRAYPNYHNGMRFLTEVAATHLATPVILPADRLPKTLAFDPQQRSWRQPLLWQDEVWEPADAVQYFKTTCYAVLKYAALNKHRLAENMLTIALQAVDSTRENSCFIIDKNQIDEYALELFLKTLQKGLVRIYATDSPFTKDGQSFSRGAFIIPVAQPFGYYVQTLLHRDPYPIAGAPGGVRHADVTSHNLALMYGIDVIQTEMPAIDMHLIEEYIHSESPLPTASAAENFIIDYQSSRVLKALPQLFDDFTVFWLKNAWQSDSLDFHAGSFYVTQADERAFIKIAAQHQLKYSCVEKIPKRKLLKLHRPQFAIYASYLAVEEEGWLRFLFDQFGYEFDVLQDADIQNLPLSDFSAIIIPGQEADDLLNGYSEKQVPKKYTGGLGWTGTNALIRYVKNGGTLITIGLANEYIRHYFPTSLNGLSDDLTFYEYQAPGVHLQIHFDTQNPLTFGMPNTTAVFAFNPPVWRSADALHAGTFSKSPLLSGWMMGESYLAETPGLSQLSLEKGEIIMMSFHPYFRAQSFNTVKVLFNSLLSSAIE